MLNVKSHLDNTALLRGTREFSATALWNDSADPDELSRSISFGAVGATCNPVDEEIFGLLYERLLDFRRAYEPDGMTLDEFQDFGATRTTLRQFLDADQTGRARA